jgi:CO dehydrogenase nickel-insertion accessory protein CooC1
MKSDVLDKFDADAWIDSYSDQLGVDPSMIVASDKVAIIRQQRNQAQAAQQQTAMQEQQSKTTKNLAQAPVGQSNALDLMNQYSGYGSPSPAQPLPPA